MRNLAQSRQYNSVSTARPVVARVLAEAAEYRGVSPASRLVWMLARAYLLGRQEANGRVHPEASAGHATEPFPVEDFPAEGSG